MPSPAHKELMQYLNKRVKQERWQKLPKKQGKVISKSITASENIKLELENLPFYVLKRNKNLYAIAETIHAGDVISIALRQQLGKLYCVKLVKKGQGLGKWMG